MFYFHLIVFLGGYPGAGLDKQQAKLFHYWVGRNFDVMVCAKADTVSLLKGGDYTTS